MLQASLTLACLHLQWIWPTTAGTTAALALALLLRGGFKPSPARLR